ncbi:uncharacterized protein BP5553_05097 [Venustampulla echinocandica]|uniref:UBZ4-type domain-containing protein n=1 Tax=Venustampulla echinocandica TaxID=2656787 RepID=A0A370TQ58_9HELO|nr:uncharacterized protein BP5553_05097 [Venustampulla echinocandica]RDL37664.1 hypothetical protein BP5553_05097 [Venustampulla echinocandica]
MSSSHHFNGSNRGRMGNSSRGRGSRGRGGFNDRSRNRDSTLKPVPSIQQVIVGSSVSMVLKVDQVTGREVQGVVAELLTRGNHPRGIKVRLQDGRVGRVQKMISEDQVKRTSAELSGLDWNERSSDAHGGDQSTMATSTTTSTRETFSRRKYGDFRTDEPDEPPSGNLSLADYVVVKGKGKGQRSKTGANQNQVTDSQNQDEESGDRADFKSTISTCPVCGEFEGDEVAVAHHVNGHFD